MTEQPVFVRKTTKRETWENRVKRLYQEKFDRARTEPKVIVSSEEEQDFGAGQVESLLRYTIDPHLSLDMSDAEDDADAIHQLNALKKRGRILKKKSTMPPTKRNRSY